MKTYKRIVIIFLLIIVLTTIPSPAFATNPMRIITEENVISVHTGP